MKEKITLLLLLAIRDIYIILIALRNGLKVKINAHNVEKSKLPT
jgi:hypothetical protein